MPHDGAGGPGGYGGPLIRITIRGGGLAIVDGLAYAAILPPPHPATWIASPAGGGAIRFTDRDSGLILAASGTGPGTQAGAVGRGAAHPVTAWRVSRCDDAGSRRPSAVADPSELTSGYYLIEEPATGARLYRNRVEEPGLRPQPVALQPVGLDQGPLILQVVGEH